MQINWPQWFLPIHPFQLVRNVRAWRRRRHFGLPPLRTPPVTQIPEIDRDAYARSSYRPQPVRVPPYARQGMDYLVEDELLDLDDPSLPLDADGVMLWRDSKGSLQHHPVAMVQYALAALGGFSRTGDHRYLDRAIVNAHKLIECGELDESGTLWFPYRFPYSYYDVTMPVPWWSCMAQGQALSLFCRLAGVLTDDASWLNRADQTFASFSGWRRLGAPWITTIDANGLLWFEEYAGDVEPLLVVNGHVFALYGLYDYAMLTGNELAVEFFDGGATTIRQSFDGFRVEGGTSYYCLRSGYCQRPEWQNASYHPIHIQQLRMLAEMTGDRRFEKAAQLLEIDQPMNGMQTT